MIKTRILEKKVAASPLSPIKNAGCLHVFLKSPRKHTKTVVFESNMAPGLQHKPHGVLMGAWDATPMPSRGKKAGVLTFPPEGPTLVLMGAPCNPTRPLGIPKSLYQKAPVSDADFFKLKLMPCGQSEPLAVWTCVYSVYDNIIYNNSIIYVCVTIFLVLNDRVYRSFPAKKSILYWYYSRTYYSRTGTALGPRFFKKPVLSSLAREPREPAKALPQLPILQPISPKDLFCLLFHLGTMVLLEPCPELFLENQQLNFNHAKPKLLVTRWPQDARTWDPENHLNHVCALLLFCFLICNLCLGNHLTRFHGCDPANSTQSWALCRKDKASLCKPLAIHICLPGHNSDELRRTK